MQSSLNKWKRWIAPLAFVGIAAALLLLSNRKITNPDGFPILDNPGDYDAANKEAEGLSLAHFKDFDHGVTLTDKDKKDLRRAAGLFDSMDRLYPAKIEPYLGAGKAYQIIGEYAIADERLRQCISNLPYASTDADRLSVIEAKYLLSVVRGYEGDWKSAFTLADSAVADSKGKSAIYLTARASAETQTGKESAARIDVAKALAIDPFYQRALDLQKLLIDTPDAPPAPKKP